MKKIDFLKYALQNECFKKKSWIVKAFTITKENPKDPGFGSVVGTIIRQPWGYTFVNDKIELEPIEDSDINKPLFAFSDVITIDNTWCLNVTEPTRTCIGNLLFNLISIVPNFGTKIPFMKGRISVSDVEDLISSTLVDTPLDENGEVDTTAERRTDVFYVDEYIKFVDSLQFLNSLSQIASWAATPKTITAPPGIKQFKQELLEKYKGKLTDPVELAKFEKELLDFDAAYMKGDPSDGKFVSGKIKNIARKKMFLDLGSEKTFEDTLKVVPVINSLEEGLPTDPVEFTSLMNGLRMGSFSRGSETVKGGVSAKVLLRASNNFKILDQDCGSKLGIHRRFNESNIEKMIGRYLVFKDKIVSIENKTVAANYLNQDLIVRSPMYCKLEGEKICKICAGDKLSKFPKGLTIPVTEISSIILATSLKAMHGTVLSTAKIELDKAFS